jgi:predicted dehydrogenase
MGRWHAHAASRAGVTISAVVDPQLDVARRLAARFGATPTRALSDLRTLDVDVVHLCTPLDTHFDLAREALGSGWHTVVEKPITPTAAETRELLRTASAAGRLICPVHQFVFQPGFLSLQRALPDLGRLRHFAYAACSAGADGGDAVRRDRIAVEILPHPFSIFSRTLPGGIDGLVWTVAHPVPGELLAISTAGDATVSLFISMSGRPTSNTLEVIATDGTVHVDLFHGYSYRERPIVSRSRKILRPIGFGLGSAAVAGANLTRRALRREPAYPGLRELLSRFYDAVAGSSPPPFSDAETLSVAFASERLRELM